MNGLTKLRKRYPWPAACPDVSEEMHGWFAGENRRVLASLLNEQTRVVLELGSWFGMSAKFIAEHAPHAVLICIDHWKGSPEHHRRPEWRDKLPVLYDKFLRNLWPYRGRTVPMRTTTIQGMQELHALEIVPDVIYVDAAHDEESVFSDTTTALRLFPKAEILGDDWPWDSVRKGVVRAAHRMRLMVHGIACWQIPVQGRP